MNRLLVTALATGAGAGIFSIVIPVALWPGEAKLTAPLFCEPPHTEPMIVSDTWHDSEGTSTNYTLYCVGDRGTLTDEGFALPMLVLLTARTCSSWQRWCCSRGCGRDGPEEAFKTLVDIVSIIGVITAWAFRGKYFVRHAYSRAHRCFAAGIQPGRASS